MKLSILKVPLTTRGLSGVLWPLTEILPRLTVSVKPSPFIALPKLSHASLKVRVPSDFGVNSMLSGASPSARP